MPELTLTQLHESMQSGFKSFGERFDGVTIELKEIKQRLGKVENRVEDVYDLVLDLSGAEAKDAAASINHEGRIAHLETLSHITPLPPRGLAV